MMQMSINQAGVELIKAYEGIMDGDPSTVNLEPYIDPSGYWTIGWGHLLTLDGKPMHKSKFTKQEAYKVYPGGLTLQQAEQLLFQDIAYVEKQLNSMLKVELNENQFSALVSLVYNIGVGNFKKSTMLKYLNNGEFDKASEEFTKFVKSGNKVLPGLVNRRKAEQMLFNRPVFIPYKPMTNSRVILGSVGSAVSTASVLAKEYLEPLLEMDKTTLTLIGIGLLVAAICFSIYAAWARYTDRKKGFK